MVELDQIKIELGNLAAPLAELESSVGISDKLQRIEELRRLMEEPNFWDDNEKAQRLTKELKDLEDTVDTINELKSQHSDIGELISMAYEENDEALIPDIQNEFAEFSQKLDDLRISTLLSGEYDRDNAILRLNAGAGGTESCDWAGMLFRMYSRYAEKKGFSVEVLDMLDGDEAGIKSVTFQINGTNAY